ncbi:hypothetical protein EIP91_009286 [Steccherinum ochraceum]|uniref:Glycoside hydrolase family 71 protein n=1 Tax=Steccherinum ochraceum TaxID=92696 RepID=A0A4R0R4H5_9APHY|nr:hypothetical protein EIP91_009286 [Steccherinum ochraceum]
MVFIRAPGLRKAALVPLLLACLTSALPQNSIVNELVDAFSKIFELPAATPSPTSTSNSTAGNATQVGAASVDPSQPTPTVNCTDTNTTQAAIATATPAQAVAVTPGNMVFAHHIVGNTYNYTLASWTTDIMLAAAKGVDAFALNVGADSWEPGQVANAYQAARSLNTPFKLFLSFDMSTIPCTTAANSALLRSYVTNYTSHPNQLKYNNASFVSTFAGEGCKFGASTVNQGWINTLKTNLTPTYFVPSFFVDPATFSSQYSVQDGAFNWNSGWPMGNYDINFSSDQLYINNLASKTYMGAVSPWFFTHYGPQSYNKNFIYRGDNWLFAERWEALIANRTKVQFAEVISWNDYGESHYIGPVQGVQPMSQSWVNGFDHQGWLDLMQYYITAYKTGAYPAVARDRTFLWGRLYPVNATSPDPVAKPTNYLWTQDFVWGVVLLSSPATVQLNCGAQATRAMLPAGLSKISLYLTAACTVNTTITRGANTTTFAPSNYKFSLNPPSYNFNALVVASP